MNKLEFISVVSDKTGMTKTDVARILDAEIATVTETLVAGDSVVITGFGSFKPVTRKARMAYNPQTKKRDVEVPEKTVAKFSVGKSLKEALAPKPKVKPKTKKSGKAKK